MWLPVQHPQHGSPMLDAGLVLAGALIVMLVAALGHNTPWMIGSGIVAGLALVRLGWLENR